MKIFGRKRDGGGSPADYDAAYLGLRNQVLTLTADQLATDVLGAPVIAVLMETGYPEAVATLVGVIDGSTSLYLSNGGGVLGAGEHRQVADATHQLIQVAGEHVAQLAPTLKSLPPMAGQTQFVAVTSQQGLLAAVAAEQELGAGQHLLSLLFFAGQNVITQIRLLEEKSA